MSSNSCSTFGDNRGPRNPTSICSSGCIIRSVPLIRKTEQTTVKLNDHKDYSRLCNYTGRRGGLVVSALDSGSKGLGSSPGQVIVLCSWAKHFTLTVPLSTQEYKWVPANCQGNLTKCWEVTCNGLVSHPGGVAILLVASC